MQLALACTFLALVYFTLASDPARGSGDVSPHDGKHLVVIRPGDWSATDDRRLTLVKDRGALFNGTGVPVAGVVEAEVPVQHKGRYSLWLRVARGKLAAGALDATLTQDGKTIHRAAFGEGRGSEALGGPAAFEAYAKKAKQASPLKDVELGPKSKSGNDLDDISKELATAGAKDWVSTSRLEEPIDARPFYWWNAGTVDLTPGSYRLRVQPPKAKSDPALIDLAFLTTAEKFGYPFAGDVSAPAGSYIRFRIDKLPKDGLHVTAQLRIHNEPWNTATVNCNPTNLDPLRAQPHTRPGMTRWYRLQDIMHVPAFGAAGAHLHLKIKENESAGATQFAIFPHDDHVLREINWAEPEGLNISMAMDFQKYLSQLRTFRDHAREHYEMALSATGDQLFPLTRGDLNFCNSWGQASGDCIDYMNQTLRLIGINSVGGNDQVKYRQLYGGSNAGGQYWPPVHLPYDPAKTHEQYEEYYKDLFAKHHDTYANASTFQLADEPAEIFRSEMTSPLWRFLKDDRGEKWADLPGQSDLNTRRCDLHDCVLEGKIEKHGSVIGFRVAIDNPTEPKNFAFWHIGKIAPAPEYNLATGRYAQKGVPTVMIRPGAIVAATPTAFKIVYEKDSAALYLNGKLIHQHTHLPLKGGFGFTGGAKTIRELTIRPIRKDEHLTSGDPESAPPAKKTDDLLEEFAKKDVEVKAKSLEKTVTEDWVVAGGMPAAHEGFRKWAAAQGVQPSLFGEKSWDDVRLLTVSSLIRNPEDARLYYWSRVFSGQLTTRMFGLAAESIRNHEINPNMRSFVALSGHSLYFPSAMPLDMFKLAQEPAVQPGISDWMSTGSWFWDSHQVVAYSVAPFNAGARRYGDEPLNYPMMHCVWPNVIRSYTMLANQVRTISFFNYGPSYSVTEGYWSEMPSAYVAVHKIANRSAQVDDLLTNSRMRPSRVAMLYSMANEYWRPQSSFADKRAAFLALSHEYFQPELVTEEQVEAGALKHYDALYVLDPLVKTATQDRIASWVQEGGMLWTCADALTFNEFNEPLDMLAKTAGLKRTFSDKKADKESTITPVKGESDFRPHSVVSTGKPTAIDGTQGRTCARYDDGSPAWMEMPTGEGKIVYVGHRAGLTYTAKKARNSGFHTIWADTGRDLLTRPLHEAKVVRELLLSEPLIMASPLSSPDGTVIVLYNMQPTPRTKLQINLREPARPHSVEVFLNDKLQAIPFEYNDGRLSLTLPQLIEEQMVVVRRKPAPADTRIADLRKLTEKQLVSSEPATLAAGAWVAGFHPDWQMSDQLIALLANESWLVRRAAAEALGRTENAAAGNALAVVIQKERDAHVLGDALVSLARLNHADVPARCRELLRHPDAWVRSRAMRAVDQWSKRHATEEGERLAKEAVTIGLADRDTRVRHPAIALAGRVEPVRAVQEALHSPPADLGVCADAIVANDTAFNEFKTKLANASNPLLDSIALRRSDPALAEAMLQRVDQIGPADQPGFMRAAIAQNSPGLTRALFERRAKLAPTLASHLAVLLENTFGARLGNNLADWEQWLKETQK